MPTFKDLIDIPSAQMPQKFADQKSAGWQCISMAARGGIPALQGGPFCTSTWVKQSGPDQTFMPSVGGGDFDDRQ
jgi:hypothetical protein